MSGNCCRGSKARCPPAIEKDHIPSHLVVNPWASDVESSSLLDFVCLLDSWTTFSRLMVHKITPAISNAWHLTTKYGGICKRRKVCSKEHSLPGIQKRWGYADINNARSMRGYATGRSRFSIPSWHRFQTQPILRTYCLLMPLEFHWNFRATFKY